MKLLNKQIDMISWTSIDGELHPIRFRLEENNEIIIVKVKQILHKERNQHGGRGVITFRCISIINGMEKIYELTYNCDNQKWLLKKI